MNFKKYSFTDAEQKVINMIINQCLKNKEIASEMNMSVKNVERIKAILFQKTNVKNTQKLICWASLEGLIV